MSIPEEDKPYSRQVMAYVLTDVLNIKKVEHAMMRLSIAACEGMKPEELFIEHRVILRQLGMQSRLPNYIARYETPDDFTLLLYLRATGKESATNSEVNLWAWNLWKKHRDKVRRNESA